MKSTPSSKARSLSFSPWRIRETIYLRFKGPKKLNLGIYQVLKGERGERGEARQTENPGSPHCMQEMAHTCRRAATAVLVCTHASEIRSAFSHKEQREGRTAARAAGPLAPADMAGADKGHSHHPCAAPAHLATRRASDNTARTRGHAHRTARRCVRAHRCARTHACVCERGGACGHARARTTTGGGAGPWGDECPTFGGTSPLTTP